MKRTELKRTSVLVAKTGLARTGSLARSGLSSTRRIAAKPVKRVVRYTGPDRATRKLVFERDGGRCVHCGASGTALHHRRARGMAGSSDPAINSPANLLTVCHDSHMRIESNREWAVDQGYLVPRGIADPCTVPVAVLSPWPMVGNGYSWVVLNHDGQRTRVTG